MRKKSLNAYKAHASAPSLDKRSETIMAKAKRYNIPSLQNPSLTQTLLQPTPTKTNSSQQAINLIKWLLECETKTQMSSGE